MTKYLLKIEVISVVPGDEISTSDFIRLKETVKAPAFKFKPILTEISLSSTELPKEPTTPEVMSQDYKSLYDKATAIKLVLENRVGQNLNMPIDPNTQPEVWEAAHRLFKGNFNQVPYKMYLTLLNYMEDLGRELGDALR